MKDIVVGCITGYDFEKIKPWVNSLDRSGFDGLLGTVAGDDTIMCVATEEIGGAGLANQFRMLSGVSDVTGGIPRKKGVSHV
jgi:hypothetical protein